MLGLILLCLGVFLVSFLSVGGPLGGRGPLGTQIHFPRSDSEAGQYSLGGTYGQKQCSGISMAAVPRAASGNGSSSICGEKMTLH